MKLPKRMISFSINADELDTVKARAEKAGLSTSQYFRVCALTCNLHFSHSGTRKAVNRKVSFAISLSDLNIIREKARDLGLSVSEYFRLTALHGRLKIDFIGDEEE